MMTSKKSPASDNDAFVIMAGAYALAFRAETGKLPESHDRHLTASQALPLWTHIFARLDREGSSLQKAIAVAEKNAVSAGVTDFSSASEVLAVNIAVLRNPSLQGGKLRERAAEILRSSLDLAQSLIPNAHNLSVAAIRNSMPPIYLDILLAQLGGDDINDIELKGQSTERLAEMVLLRRQGIEPQELKAQGKQLIQDFTDAAAQGHQGNKGRVLQNLRAALIGELRSPAGKTPSSEPS